MSGTALAAGAPGSLADDPQPTLDAPASVRVAGRRPPPLVVDGPRPAVERVAALRRVVTARERVVLLTLALASPDGLEAVVDVHELAAWAGLHRAETHSILRRLTAPAEYRPALLERVDVDRAHLVTFRLLPHGATTAPDTPKEA